MTETHNDGTPKTLREIERELILGRLARHNGDKKAVARECGISLKTIYNKLHSYEHQA